MFRTRSTFASNFSLRTVAVVIAINGGLVIAQPAPSGACCDPSAGCYEGAAEVDCTGIGGSWLGDGSVCAGNTTCPIGACCLSGGACAVTDALYAYTEPYCQASGGAYQGDDSTCAGITCMGACCDPAAGCFQNSAEVDCTGVGGTWLGEGSVCAGNTTCPIGACCLSGGECELTDALYAYTEPYCQASGGAYRGDDSTCAGITCMGACCDPAAGCFQNSAEVDCTSIGGTWLGEGSVCAGNTTCPIGACCLSGGECELTDALYAYTEPYCQASGGAYQGDDSTCAGITCMGACCDPAAGCFQNSAEVDCTSIGGTWVGEGSVCTGNTTCPTGACCLSGGECDRADGLYAYTESYCQASGGAYQGDDSTCDGITCLGACCDPLVGCSEGSAEVDCSGSGGAWLGEGSVCAGNTVCPIGACCVLGDCEAATEAYCSSLGGTYLGDQAACAADGTPTVTVTITNDPQPVALDISCQAVITFEITITDDCCVDADNLGLIIQVTGGFDDESLIVNSPVQVSANEVSVTGRVVVEDPFNECSSTLRIEARAEDCSENSSNLADDSVEVRDQTKPGFGEIFFPDVCYESPSDMEFAVRNYLENVGFDNCDHNLEIVELESDLVCDATLRLALEDACENQSDPAVFEATIDGIRPQIGDPEPIEECYATAEEAIAAAKAAAEAVTTDDCDDELEFFHFLDQDECRADIDIVAEDECENRSDDEGFFTTIDPFAPFATCFFAVPLPVEVDANCEATVEFRAEINDNCCLDRDTLQITATVPDGAAQLQFTPSSDCDIQLSPIDEREARITCQIKVSALTRCEVPLTVEVTMSDCCGQPLVMACSRIATIVDPTPPVITCPEDITLDRGDKICSSDVQDWLDSATITDTCNHQLQSDAPECGFPPGTTTTVTFGAEGCGACTSEITIGPAPRVDVSKKGSLLAFSKVDLRWNAAGALTQDTFVTLSNDYPQDVYVQMYFVNGDAAIDPVFSNTQPPVLLSEGEPGWNWVDCQLLLTPDQPIYWSASTGNPAGCQPFTILDPDLGNGPGRPAPDANDGSRALRGFVLAFAVDQSGREIQWNHLSGKATIVDYSNTSAWEYDTSAFQANCGEQGEQPLDCTLFDDQGVCCTAEVIPGALGTDGFQYDYAFDALLLDFFGVGSQALSGPGAPVTVDTDLTLHILSADLRQETEGPVTTKAHFDIWNSNERKLSNTRRCLTCWDQTLLSQYGAPNSFLQENLQTDKGKARLDGKQANECEENCFRDEQGEPLEIEELIELVGELFDPAEFICSQDAALLGLAAKYLAFSGPAGQREVAGSNLVGMGTEHALIQYDVVDAPGTLRTESYDRIQHDSPRIAPTQEKPTLRGVSRNR